MVMPVSPAAAAIGPENAAVHRQRQTAAAMPAAMIAEPMTASGIMPAPMTMPTASDQNRNTISTGSLMAVRKRTMDSAPTMPRDRTTLLVTAIMTSVVTRDRPTSVSAKPLEYSTPVSVFL